MHSFNHGPPCHVITNFSGLLSSPPRPNWLWGPPSLLSNGYRGWSGRFVKLTTHLLLQPRSKMRGAIPPPPKGCLFEKRFVRPYLLHGAGHSLKSWLSLSLSKKILLSYGTRRFITVFTQARHWILSWASWIIQFTPSIPISLRSILMLSSHLRLGLPSGLLPSGLPTNRWVPCHHGMARPQVADEVLRVRRVAANVMNKQSRTADKGWSSSLGVGSGANNPSP
jgi:hypothetical protein